MLNSTDKICQSNIRENKADSNNENLQSNRSKSTQNKQSKKTNITPTAFRKENKDVSTVRNNKVAKNNNRIVFDESPSNQLNNLSVKKEIIKDITSIVKSSHNEDQVSHLGEYIEEPFQIIESYFHSQYLERLVRFQVESYNHFVNYQIQRTIHMFNPVIIHSENDFVAEYNQYFLEIHISFENFKLYPPQIHENNGATKVMLPQEAKLRNFTYSSGMTVDVVIKYIVRNTEKMDIPKIYNKILPKINIGKMPIMVKSSICVLTQNKHIPAIFTGECEMDCGGYFIVKGSEKTVLGQERAAENKIYCFDGKNTTKWSWYAEIKSVPDFKCISPKQIEMMIANRNNGFGHGIFMTIPRIKQPIELFIVFRALGIISDKDICKFIILDINRDANTTLLNMLQASIIDANKIITQEDALRYITSFTAYTPINMDKETGIRKKREFTIEVLNNDLFPHCKTATQKLYLVGYMAKRLMQVSIKLFPPDDRDSFVNKRIELTGTLLNNLFRNYFNKLVKEMQKQVVREINTGSWHSNEDYSNIINMTNIYKIMKSTTIENGINRALSTGDFSIKQSNSSKVGVAQVLSRLTYLSTLSHLRRINTPLEKSGELIAPRKLHNTTWGFLCLTGDTDILLSNRISTRKICNIKDGDSVNTINTKTLFDQPSSMHLHFGNMPERLYEITTISGRIIKATGEHPFLVYNRKRDYVWKTVDKLVCIEDKVIIRHTNPSTTLFADRDIEIISKFQCENGNPLAYTDNFEPYLESTIITLHNNYLNNIMQIYNIFNQLNIICRVIIADYYDNTSKVYIQFDQSYENLIRYVDTVNYTYCEDKRLMSAPIIEHLKIKISNRKLCNVFIYNTFIKNNILEDRCIAVPILSIIEIIPEMVYDFTTKHHNHSFVASSFVVSNCVAESPEGQSIGIVKNLSYMAHITSPINSSSLYEYIAPYITPVDNIIDQSELFQKIKVFVNGVWLGVTETPHELYNEMKNKKYCGIINIYTSVIFDYKLGEIRLCSDGGRLVRPLLRVRDGKAIITSEIINQLANKEISWNDMLTNCKLDESVIEYIDPEEQNLAMIALIVNKNENNENILSLSEKKLSYNYTHSEIHHSTIFGLLASCIPFPEHNQSPRNCYQCLDENEIVWMADKTKKSLKEIIVGDKVLTFHPKTLDITETIVVGTFIQRNSRVVYKIRTVSGREILATEDHTFMTEHGWKTVEDIIIMHNNNNNSTVKIGMAIDCVESSVMVEYYKSHAFYKSNGKDLPHLLALYAYWRDKYILRENCANRNISHNSHTSCIFISIYDIVKYSEIGESLVGCIETESENHSFITTHGILSKNCCMSKQAIGVFSLNFDHRMDKTAYVLTTPSRPLVDTRLMNIIKLNRIPSGHQIHLAIMSYTGYNMEDSILINKGSIDRGLFATTIYHTEKDEDKNIVRDEIIRCKPDKTKTKCIKFGNYDKLNADGFIPENTLVENRDVIIAKILPIKENRNDPTKLIKYEDQSKTYRTTEQTYIDKNYTGRNGDGYDFAKVRTRIFRKPVIGDKFSSRSGQKGTCGNIIPECDMPYTKEGLRPDFIINPHAIPSRMTIAQLKETLLGKVLLELGLFGDGTSFGNLDIQTIASELQKLGHESHGNEIMYNGMTGEQIETSIFFGPVYYQRLKHMVNDKQHSRSIGPMVNLTRQPAEGRSRDGGFRIGEMERDVMIAHGMTRFCRERLYDVSDKYSVYICNKCGLTASYNDGQHSRLYKNHDFTIHLCKTCNNMTDFSRVEIPYAYKLLSQELQTINVAMRLITN